MIKTIDIKPTFTFIKVSICNHVEHERQPIHHIWVELITVQTSWIFRFPHLLRGCGSAWTSVAFKCPSALSWTNCPQCATVDRTVESVHEESTVD